jgi:hypothetical protein
MDETLYLPLSPTLAVQHIVWLWLDAAISQDAFVIVLSSGMPQMAGEFCQNDFSKGIKGAFFGRDITCQCVDQSALSLRTFFVIHFRSWRLPRIRYQGRFEALGRFPHPHTPHPIAFVAASDFV